MPDPELTFWCISAYCFGFLARYFDAVGYFDFGQILTLNVDYKYMTCFIFVSINV